MIEIKEFMCPRERYYIKCPYTRIPTRIVIHNSGNDAPAENEIAYMISRPEQVSFHFAVDEKKAVQGLPLDRNAWASGDGHGRGNMEGIHIEMCYSLSGGTRFNEAERNAAGLTAQLLHEYGWDISAVTKHRDYDGKYCPHRTLDRGWSKFISMVEKYLKEFEEVEEMTAEQIKAIVREVISETDPVYETLEDIPSYWQKEIKDLMDRGILLGEKDGKLNLRRSEARCAVLIQRAWQKSTK